MRRVKKYAKIENDNNLDWLEPFLIQSKRILKPDAHAYIFCSHHHLDVFLSTVKKHLPYKNLLVWNKKNGGMGDLRGDYSPQTEFIIFCSNGKRKLNGKRDPNVLEFKRSGNKLAPTQKPVELIEYLIGKSSKEGEIVLDPFAGSSTTAIAAMLTNRNWLMMEKDQYYYNVSRERIGEKRMICKININRPRKMQLRKADGQQQPLFN
jgi:site-specific DNA-methyltransferase (adenine-specific)